MIALFDSGYGGLTVFQDVVKQLPEYDYLYLGDNARNPYGNHSRETVIQFCEEAVEYLFARGAKLILFACNTTSSLALRHIQKKYLVDAKVTDRKILGVIRPVAEASIKLSKSQKIGVVGTRGTVNSKTYDIELQKLNPDIKVFSRACPLLVPLVEEGWHTKPEAVSILKKYLLPLKKCNIDTLILGCTHYPFMKKDFIRIMGKNTQIITAGKIVAESLKDYLHRHPEIESQLTKKSTRTFMTTDDSARFQNFAKQFLSLDISNVEKVQL